MPDLTLPRSRDRLGYWLDGSGLQSRQMKKVFLFPNTFKLALGPTSHL
jgi:hypothetical protein